MLSTFLSGLAGAALAGTGIILFRYRRRPKIPPPEDTLEKMTRKWEAEMIDRRNIERELAHLASFAEQAPNIIIESDVEGTVGYINPACQEEFPDLTQQGKNHPALAELPVVIDVMRRERKALFMRPLKIGEKVYDQRISLLDGGPRIRLYMTDITELKKLDQLKNDFVNMVSHELRTPLTTIQATIKMVAAELLGGINKDQKEALSMANVNIERLGRMINDLLDISKIEAGKLEIRRQPVKLRSLIQELGAGFEPLARDRGLELHAEAGPDAMELFIDRDKVIQIFTNLINNAFKFTERGAIRIGAEPQDGAVCCRVEDTGPGIAPQDVPKVFGKFQQLGAPARGREKGTGLGLSLCKGLVELHGGKIWVESTLSQGTCFYFTLPRVQPQQFFVEHVHKLFEEAVARSKPLSIFSFKLDPWDTLEQKLGAEKAAGLLGHLEALIQKFVRSESDFAVYAGNALWMALPTLGQTDARQITKRIEEAYAASPLGTETGIPLRLICASASYPEDGPLPEKLLASLSYPVENSTASR